MSSFPAIRFVLLAVLLATAWVHTASGQPVVERCAEYATQDEAQRAFDANPGAMRDLDDDNDGIACEHLPAGVVTDSGPGIVPWIAAGVVIIGAGAGAVVLRRLNGDSTPSPAPPPSTRSSGDDETAVEIDLAALKAEHERDTTTPGQQR